MRKAYELLSLLMLASLLLAACGSPTPTAAPATSAPATAVPENPTAAPATQPPAATPGVAPTTAAAKVLRVQLYEDMQNVDPAFYPSDADESIMADVYQGLVGYKPGTFEVQNVLAETVTPSADGKVIDFKLKENVQFHHGYGELTADDVKFSYERLIDPELSAVYASDWATLDHVEVTGKYTGQIVLKEPFAPLWITTLPGTSGYILSKKAVTEKGVKGIATFPVGTGPYEFQEWQPNQLVRLTRFAQYWGQAPEWDELVHQYIPEDSSVEIALETGELDFGRVAPSAVGRFENNPKYTVYAVPTLDWEVLFMNVQHPLLQDANVRKAIRAAVDVDAINQAVYEGRYQPLCNLLTPQMLGYWPDAPCHKRDLQQARAFMAEAGVTDLELHAAIQNTEQEKAVGEILQANLADIGIKLTLDIQDDAAFVEEGFGPEAVKRRELVYLNWVNFPDPSMTTMFFKCDQTEQWNWMYWCDPEFDKLHDASVREMDPAKRAALYVEMQKKVEDIAGAVFVSNIVMYYVGRSDLSASIMPHGRILAWNFTSK